MKVRVGYEELRVVVLDGDHLGGLEVDLPEDVVKRCRTAQSEWDATGEILHEAYHAAKEQSVKCARE